MYSFYVLHKSDQVNNNDTDTFAYVLADRDDLRRALDALLAECVVVCQLRVYQRGRLTATFDLLERTDSEEFRHSLAIPPLQTIPALAGTPLPPGHPVQVDGRTLAYGCNRFYP